MTKADEEAIKEYHEKVLATGVFIDKDFLEDVLSSSKDEDIKVCDYKVQAAVGAGDNFLGILYKTHVAYKTSESDQEQTCSLMVKGVPTAKMIQDMIEDMGVFRKEIAMYTECLPAMHAKLREYFPEGTPYVAPDSYKCTRENTLVMEDLTVDGYKMASRRDQLDFDHCAATLRTLARFHALSCKVYEEDPEMITKIAQEFYTEENKVKMAQFLEVCFPLLASVVEKWGDNSKYAPILLEAGKNIWDKLVYMVKPSGEFNVLNHGDMWVNNIMYKYDEDGNVENAKLVDFQLARYSTPAMDLHYFFFTSPKPDVLSEKMDELLEIYHSALVTNLLALDLDVNYSLEQLHQDMRNKATFGLLALAQILPIIVAPPSAVLDFDEYNDIDDKSATADNPLLVNFQTEYYQEVAGKFLEHMDRVGYLQDALDLDYDGKGEVGVGEEEDGGLVGDDSVEE